MGDAKRHAPTADEVAILSLVLPTIANLAGYTALADRLRPRDLDAVDGASLAPLATEPVVLAVGLVVVDLFRGLGKGPRRRGDADQGQGEEESE